MDALLARFHALNARAWDAIAARHPQYATLCNTMPYIIDALLTVLLGWWLVRGIDRDVQELIARCKGPTFKPARPTLARMTDEHGKQWEERLSELGVRMGWAEVKLPTREPVVGPRERADGATNVARPGMFNKTEKPN